MLEIGHLTVRMVFFTIAVFLSILIILNAQRIEKSVGFLLPAFLSLMSVATLNGLVNDADIKDDLRRFKAVVFHYDITIAFSLFVQTKQEIDLIVKIIKVFYI